MIRGINPLPLGASPGPFCVCLALLCSSLTPWKTPIPAGWLLPWNEGSRERVQWQSGHPKLLTDLRAGTAAAPSGSCLLVPC